jgi:hypothetical protein
MSRPSLQPVASPVDTFRAPEIRPPAAGDDALARTAHALSQFNQNLAQSVQIGTDLAKEEAQRWALEQHAKRQLKSLNDFEGAVKRGEISEDRNPWKMVFLRKLVARDQVRTSLIGLEDRFNNAADEQTQGIKASQSITALSGWADAHIGEATQGLDSWSASGVADLVDDWKGSFLARQQNEWERQRSLTTEIGFRREFSHQLEGIANSPTPVEKPDVSGLQGLIDANLKVTANPEKATQMALESLAGVAIAARDPNLVQRVAGEVKVGGKSLSSLAAPEQLKKINEDVEDAVYRDLRMKRVNEEASQTALGNQLLDQFSSLHQQANAAGKFLDPNTIAVDVAKLPAEQQVRVQQIIDKITSDDLDRQVSAALTGADPESPRTMSLMESLLTSTYPGAESAARKIQEWRQFRQQGQYASETSLPTLQKLNELMLDGSKSSAQKLSELTDLTMKRQVSRNDAERYQQTFMSVGRLGRDEGSTTLQQYMVETTNALENAAYADPANQPFMADLFGNGSHALPPQITNDIQTKAQQLVGAFQSLYASNPHPTLPELKTVLDKVKADILKGSQVDEARLKAGQQLSAIAADPHTAITHQTLTWKKDHFEAEVDGAAVKIPNVRLFTTAKGLETGMDQAFESLKISDEKDQTEFLRRQVTALPQGEAVKATQMLREKFYGTKAVRQADNIKRDLDGFYRVVNADASNPEAAPLLSEISNIVFRLQGSASPQTLQEADDLLNRIVKAQYIQTDWTMGKLKINYKKVSSPKPQ